MPNAYLEITLEIDTTNRESAVAVYRKYKQPFLDQINGAKSKKMLVRDKDVQVIHGFVDVRDAEAYLKSDLFTKDVVEGLKPFLSGNPDIRIYAVV